MDTMQEPEPLDAVQARQLASILAALAARPDLIPQAWRWLASLARPNELQLFAIACALRRQPTFIPSMLLMVELLDTDPPTAAERSA